MKPEWNEFPCFVDNCVVDVRIAHGCIDQHLLPLSRLIIRTGVVIEQMDDIYRDDGLVIHNMVGLDVEELRLQATAYNDFQHDKPGSPALQFREVLHV